MRFGWMVAALALLPAAAQAKKGLYFGFDLGYASVSGETGIKMSSPGKDPDGGIVGCLNPTTGKDLGCRSDLSILNSTQEGEGFAVDFIFGYNILGFVAIEAQFSASGNQLTDYDHIEGQGGIYGLIRLFPAQLFEEVADRWWDPYVYVGGGGHYMGYYPEAHEAPDGSSAGKMQNEGRSWWPGAAVKYGFGCDFYPVQFISLGLDFGFTNIWHDEFHIDDDPEITDSPAGDSASAFAFTSTAKITFHFLTE